MTFMKKIVPVGAVLAVGLTLAACGKQDQHQEASAHNKNQPYKIGVLRIDDALPVKVAQQEGLFKKAGVNVEIVPFKSSSAESQAMESHSIDLMMNDMVVQSLLRKANCDTKIMAIASGATPQEGRFVVVSAPHSGIKTAKEFYGKKVGISNNTMMQYLIDSYYDNLHLNINKVQTVNIPNLQTRMEALLSGRIAGAILPDPLASVAIKKGATPVIDDTKLKENFSQSFFIASDQALQNRKADTNKVMKEIFVAMKQINQNPQKYLPLERKFSRVPQPLQATYPMPHYTPDAKPTNQEVNNVQNWLVKQKLLNKKYSYNELVEQ